MRLDPNRRQFLKNVTRTAVGVCGAGVILGLQQQQAKAKEESPCVHLVLYRKRISWQPVPVADSVSKHVHTICCI